MKNMPKQFPARMLKKGSCIVAGSALFLGLGLVPANAVGNGPDYTGNETINTSILHTHESMAAELRKQDAKQSAMELEVIGQSAKGRDLFLAKYLSNPENPTIMSSPSSTATSS